MFKTFAVAALAASTLLAVPANAVMTTFADFSALDTTSNIRWVNNGTTASNGTGGSLISIATQTSTVLGARTVQFSFLQPSIAALVNNINATFTLNATAASGNPAMLVNTFLLQEGIAGSFSFTTQSAIVVGSTTFAAGSNLLTGIFSTTSIFGQRGGSSGAFTGSTLGGSTITYTSDFLTFAPGSQFDFSLSLSSIASVLQAIPTTSVPTRALRSFRANSGGSFSADPAPIVAAIPEPAVWGLMIVGFGMVGLQTRRVRNAAVAA